MLDVVLDAKTVDDLQNAQGVILPVGGVGHGQIICSPDLVQVNVAVRRLDDGDTAIGVECRLQTDPREDAGVMERAQRRHAVGGKGGATFPLAAKRIVQASESAGECITPRAKQVKEWQGTAAAFGERAECETVRLEGFDGWPGQADIEGVERVGGEAQHHLLSDAARLILGGVLAQRLHETRAGRCVSVKGRAVDFEHFRHVAVGAGVPASSVRVSGKFGVFASLPARRVDVRASGDAPSVRVDRVGANLACHFQFPLPVVGG